MGLWPLRKGSSCCCLTSHTVMIQRRVTTTARFFKLGSFQEQASKAPQILIGVQAGDCGFVSMDKEHGAAYFDTACDSCRTSIHSQASAFERKGCILEVSVILDSDQLVEKSIIELHSLRPLQDANHKVTHRFLEKC
jgi:hypothetical protein